MKIAAYCRVSTEKEDQLNSLEAQKEFFSQYVSRTGDTLISLYADEGISGTKIKNRREFLRMMEDAKKGCFQKVVVKDISRFARNTVDLLQNIRKLKALGIETQFLTADMTSMGNSEFVLTIFGALAQEESANTSKRVKFGKKLNAQKGRVPNLVYGYDKTPGEYFCLAINPKEAGVVEQVYRWYVKDGYGSTQIASMLNQRKIQTKRQSRWNAAGICRLLSNELYIGKIVNGKQEIADFLTGRRTEKDPSQWIVVERPELRIIDPSLFWQAQQIMRARGKAFQTQKTRQSNRHLFSTLICCKECGWSFRRMTRTYQNTYVRWVCSKRNGTGVKNCSNGISVDEDELIQKLKEEFTRILCSQKNALPLMLRRLKQELEGSEDHAKRKKELEKRMEKLQSARMKYMDLYADDLLSKEELNQKLTIWEEEMQKAKEEQTKLSFALNGKEAKIQCLQQMFPSACNLVDLKEMTNAQLKHLIQRIEVDENGEVTIYWNRFSSST